MPRRLLKSGFRFAKAAANFRNTPRGKQLGKVWRGAEVAAGGAGLADLVNRGLKGREARKIEKIKSSPEYRRGNTSARTAMLAGLCEPKSKTGGIEKCYPKRKQRR